MSIEPKRVLALGFFDGVHLGHQALLRTAVDRAEELGLTPAVFTFDRSPKEAVTGIKVELLTTVEERMEIVRQLFAIEDVIVAPFDRNMMTMSWEAFIDLLVERYHAGHLVVGHDFRFGHRNSGTPQLLAQRCEELGLGWDIVPAVSFDGTEVSSTHIRTLLQEKRWEEAKRFLGHSLITGIK